MRKLTHDLSMAAQTADNIRDAFKGLHGATYELRRDKESAGMAAIDGGEQVEQTPEETDEQIRFFYQNSSEVFSQWSTLL